MEASSICMQGAKNLACAVIDRAVRDYASWYALHLRDPSYRTASKQCASLEEFFGSPLFDLYATLAGSDLCGEDVAAGVRNDVRRQRRRLAIAWYQSQRGNGAELTD